MFLFSYVYVHARMRKRNSMGERDGHRVKGMVLCYAHIS